MRSIIPAKIGRTSEKGPAWRSRRLMRERFAAKADGPVYGRRSQSETVNSMMKRNFGDSLRSIRPRRQRQENLLRSLAHNLMLGPAEYEGPSEPATSPIPLRHERRLHQKSSQPD